MNINDYQFQAGATAAPNADAMYFAVKLPIEACEAAQVIVKRYYHGAPLDLAKLTEELGDTLWYLANLAAAYNISLSDIAQANLDKLAARHGQAYNPAHYAA